MAMDSPVYGDQVALAQVFVPRKRFKTSELPLTSTQRATIDSLLHTVKKKGSMMHCGRRFGLSMPVVYV